MQDLEIGDGPYNMKIFSASKCPMTYEERVEAARQRQAGSKPVDEAICEAQEEAFTAVGMSL